MTMPEPASGCNLCLPEHQIDIDSGRGWQHAPEQDNLQFRQRDGKDVDYLCPRCGSRGRTRAMQTLLSQARLFLCPRPKALAVSSVSYELDIMKRLNVDVTHVSLQGNHDDPDCIVGVDVTDMPQISDDQYDVCYASCVVDYIPNAVGFLSEARRVLKTGGILLFAIQPWRLTEDPQASVHVEHRNALSHEDYARRGDGQQTEIPDCRFGIPWLSSSARAQGFQIAFVPLADILSPLTFSWFMARKLTDGRRPSS